MGRWGLQGWIERWAPAAVFALVLLAQLPLARNPGYFSHDELQWAAFAGDSGPIPWVSWIGVDAFQYRPLTFNLWLWLSRELFARPQALHALLVAWGATNAALLCALARRFGLAALPAAIAALVFALGPYAVYVHGWVATIGDLAWLSCALLAGLLIAGTGHQWRAAIVATLATAIGLLAKEAALAIPLLLALAWWFDGRQRRWAVAMLASGGVAAIYLALRIDALLHAPRDGAQYAPSLAHVPLRWLEYQWFPLLPQKLEASTTLAMGIGGSVIAAAVLWLLLLIAVWRSSRRLTAVFLLGGVAALAPVLLLAGSGNQYAYGFAAITAVVVAGSWRFAPRWGRGVIVLVAVVSVWHGVNVMRQLRRVGDVQAVFSPALADVLRRRVGPVRLQPRDPRDAWILRRLTHDIQSYDGVAIGNRATVVDAGAPADFVVLDDGRLSPMR